jgi:hypothetical protein
MVTQQGCPKDWNRKDGSWFQAMGMMNSSIIDWLRSYFPVSPAPPPPAPSPHPHHPPARQWTTQDNWDYMGDASRRSVTTWDYMRRGLGVYPLLGVVHSAAACQALCDRSPSCHAYTWNGDSSTHSRIPDSKCIGRSDGHYLPSASAGMYSGHDPAATPLLPPGGGPRAVLPSPAFVPARCGAVKQPCASDADCPSGCSRCRCFNANGAAANKTAVVTCPESYGDLIHQGFCSNDTTSHAPDCWEHPCGSCGGPPFPNQEWSRGKKQYLMIGDSVSLKMWRAVNETLLNSTADIAPFHVPINAGPADEGVRCISEWLGADLGRWDAITYNFGLWNIGPADCNLTQTKYGRYVDQALETYIGGLANITATLLQTRAAKSGKLFFVNTNPTADVKECCTSAPHLAAPGMLGTHSCYQRTHIYNQAAAALVTPHNVSIIDMYGWTIKRCGDPRTWGYRCDIVPQPNCTSPQPGQTCPQGVCHDQTAFCNLTDHNCYNTTNCDACQVHPSTRAGSDGFMSGSDYFSIPVSRAVMKALA